MKDTGKGTSMVVDMDFEMRFEGGNHVRTEFDMTFCHEFLFLGVHLEKPYTGSLDVLSESYQDGVLSLRFPSGEIVIPDCNI